MRQTTRNRIRSSRTYRRACQGRPAPGRCTDWISNPARAAADAKLDAEEAELQARLKGL
jgi:hypothetical protein